MHEDDEIVGVTHDPPVRQALLTTSLAAHRGTHRPAGPPRRVDVLIEHAQRDVRQQRGQDPSLRGPGRGVPLLTEFGEDPGLEERLDQGQHALVLHPRPDPAHQGRVVDGVETRLDISVQHPAIALGAEQVNLGDRVVRPPPGPEPVGDRHEVGLEDRFQHQLQRRLHHPVGDGGDAQPAHLPATAGLGDHAFTHRHRTELARLHLRPQIVQETLDTSVLEVDGPRPSTPADLAPVLPATRCHATFSVAGSCTRLNRSSKRAARIGRRPTVQLGLHPRYPRERPHRDRSVWSAGVHRRISRHRSLLAARYRCRPSPCDRLSRPRTTTAAPPRPDPIGRRWTQPQRRPRWTRVTVRARTETVPVFTVIRSTKEEPDFVPAASPRLPRSTSPWPPTEPPMDRSEFPDTPRPPANGRPAAPGARRSRPTSARFGAGSVLRDFETPVPRVLLSVTLAEPAPSGSASTPRRCQDCSRPPRHLPDQAVLSFTALLRQGRRRWSLTSARIVSASRRTGW